MQSAISPSRREQRKNGVHDRNPISAIFQSAIRTRALPVLVICAILALYKLCEVAGLIDTSLTPSLEDIASVGLKMCASGAFWSNVFKTWSAATTGFIVGLAIAIPLGLFGGRSSKFYHLFRPTVEFLRPLPSVAMIPIVVLLWGPSATSKAFLVCFTTVWPVFLQTVHGVRSTNPTAIDTGRAFGLNELAIIRRIILPSAAATLATSIRIQASIALLVTITAEAALGGGGGLGLLVFQLDQTGDFAGMYALLIFIGVQGMLLSTFLARLEGRLLPWHEARRNNGEQP